MRAEPAACPTSPMAPGLFDTKGKGETHVHEKRVYDSSVDHKGRVPLRASTGAWRAALFIIAIEFSERLSYFGLATNLIIYLTKVLHQEVKTAARNVNYWSGVTTMMPLVGGFVADAYLGRFSTVLCSTLIYLGGLILLTMCQLVPSLKPCDSGTCHRSLRVHEIIFSVAIYLISIGTGGHKPSLESFGADQFDDDHEEERKKKMSYFNWWNFGLCCGALLGVTVIVYIEDKVSWGVADILLTSVMGISLVIFLLGKTFYRYRVPTGSPLTPMLQVLVAAMAKRHLPHPSDAGQLHEAPKSQKSDERLLCHTDQIRFLDKAAIIEHREDEAAFAAEKLNTWRLATVTQVEETKLILAMVPIWLASLPFGICIAQTSTFFIKQASIMDRKLAGGFEIPPASVYSLAAISMIITVSFYDKILVPFLRRATGNERGMSILRRIGIGMVFSMVAMAVAAIVERKRLRVAEAEQTSVVSMSVFWLAPQFIILGFGDGFTLVGLQEYFYDQVPDSMRSLGLAFYLSVLGTANFLSSLLITVVDHLTGEGGRAGWFSKDLNRSRLDLFYWLLAAINAVNLCGYAYQASRYSYKNVQRKVGIAGFPEQDDLESRTS
ncbi:protein NRT1/ PTR FAMILY 5.6 [Cocos nucifera]|uniref:Protein NRT1/ PTR FAMILY 5.6 n=1 Tax=Cocos nucifera TaxID=13894 RepID=A0A8K0I7W6_COCNU|nr:protein NRT1/ PTR FAMILY 5.6 [Cocos nucifera]